MGKLGHPYLTFPTPKKPCSDWNFEFSFFASCVTPPGAQLIKIWENIFLVGKVRYPYLTFPTLYISAPGGSFFIMFWFGSFPYKCWVIQMATNMLTVEEHTGMIGLKVLWAILHFCIFVQSKFLFLNSQCSFSDPHFHILSYREVYHKPWLPLTSIRTKKYWKTRELQLLV